MPQTKINTVTGPIDIEAMGPTLMHEHLLIGYAGWESDTMHPGPSHDEMVAICIEKVKRMQKHGVRTMLDPCPNDLGRDVQLAAEVASKTGFNIICATGLYKEDEGGAPYWVFRGRFGPIVEQLAEMFVQELTVGIGSTGIKAGIIKVATGHGKISAHEQNVLQAAALASNRTGAPITTHTDQGTMGDEQQRILTAAGVPAHKVIIGHSCGSTDHEYHLKILQGGSYLGFDRFGLEALMPDAERVKALIALLKKNKERQIVVSHDSVWCWRGEPIPPYILQSVDPEILFNPGHFHEHIVPQLRAAGVTQAQIDEMLIANPKRFFSGSPIN